MAIFNPEPNPTSDPNYLNYSKGTDRPYADTSLGELFKGLGDIAGKFTDYPLQYAASRKGATDAVNEVENLTKPYVDTAQALGSSADLGSNMPAGSKVNSAGEKGVENTIIPPALQQINNSFARLQAAYKAGLSKEYVDARMQYIASQASLQFPGYRDYIDAAIEKNTGIQPATAVLQDVFKGLNEARTQAQKEQDKGDAYISANEKYLWEGVRDQWRRGEVTMDQMTNQVIRAQQKENNVKQMDAETAAAEKQLGLQTKVAERGWRGYLANDVDVRFNNMYNQLGPIKNMVENFQFKNMQPTADQIKEAVQQLDGMIRVYRSDAQLKANTPFLDKTGQPDKNNNSYYTILGKEAIDKEIDYHVKSFENLKNALITGDYSAAKSALTSANVRMDQSYADLLRNDKDIQTVEIIKRSLGPQGMSSLYLLPGGSAVLPNIVKSFQERFGNMTAGGEVKSQNEVMETWKRLNERDPVTAAQMSPQKIVSQTKYQFTNTNLPVDIRLNAARTFFNPENSGYIGNLSKPNQMNAYVDMTTPAVSKAINELGEQDPQLKANYKKWASDEFFTAFKNDVGNLGATFITPATKISFDPKTVQWKAEGVSPNEPASLSVAKLNLAVQNLKNIYGNDTELSQFLVNNLKTLGIDPTGEAGALGNRLWEALKNGLSAAGNAIGDAAITSAGAAELKQPSTYVQKVNQIESSNNPNAKASTSTATGLGQFTEQTWLGEVKNNGSQFGLDKEASAIKFDGKRYTVDDPALKKKILDLRTNPELSNNFTETLGNANGKILSQNGFDANDANKYLAHFAGAGGAVKILKANPNASAAEILGPEATKANPWLKRFTASGLVHWAMHKTGSQPGRDTLTPVDVALGQ